MVHTRGATIRQATPALIGPARVHVVVVTTHRPLATAGASGVRVAVTTVAPTLVDLRGADAAIPRGERGTVKTAKRAIDNALLEPV